MEFLTELQLLLGEENVYVNEPMSSHTTFRTGGNAGYFVTPGCADDIIATVEICRQNSVPYYVVGNGSNLLVSDSGYDGVIIHIGNRISYIITEGEYITAGAGALLSKIGAAALDESLTGFEFAAGIPGTIGGGCIMNAGAYGGELKDVLVKVKAVTPEGIIKEYTVDEINPGYRQTIFTGKNYIILEAVIKLKKGDRTEIAAEMSRLAALRRAKQPLEYPSAGSTFKRPEGYFSGQLIESAGLKGKGAGDACVSPKHAGFIINKGNASAKDIYDTIEMVTEEVMRVHGVKLEPEVRLIGSFS
ncbi:MAG: UDP-N-acetylmuramate dehydrogenase [Butyrivibrio sp.]